MMGKPMGGRAPLNTDLVANMRIADFSVDQLLTLLLDPQGFAERRQAVVEMIAEQDRAREALETVKADIERRTTEVADREAEAARREAASVASAIDLEKREKALAESAEQLRLTSVDLERRETALNQREAAHAAAMETLRRTTDEDVQRQQQEAKTAIQAERAQVDSEVATLRATAAAEIAGMRKRTETELLAKVTAAEATLRVREQSLIERETAFNDRLTALQATLAGR